MITFRNKFLLYSFKLLDVGLMIVAFSFSSVITHFWKNKIPFDFFNMRIPLKDIIIFSGFALIWYFLFSARQLYNSKCLSNSLSQILDIFKATFLGTFILFFISKIFDIKIVTSLFLFVFLSSVTFLTIFTRLTLRIFLGELRRNGRNLRKILIAGTNDGAIKFARNIERKPELGYQILGFVDEEWARTENFNKSGYPLVTDFKKFLPYIRKNVVDEVVINLPMRSYHRHAARIAAICEEQGIIVRQFTDVFNFKNGSSNLENLEDIPWVSASNAEMKALYSEIKRAIDLLISSVVLICAFPFFLIIAMLIKIGSNGPVFFVQERVGFNKRIFKMYKFRTMVVNSDDKVHREFVNKLIEGNHTEVNLGSEKNPFYKITNDKRVTMVGKFLRKLSLDELPQLFNVLKGDMSLVGPRPPIPYEMEAYKNWHLRRLTEIKPGITGWWQVNGRSSTTFDEMVRMDLYYVSNQSLLLDIKIILRTFIALFEHNGA